MLQPLLRLPLYNLARSTGSPAPLPLNLTFSVTFRCNARCHTCNVWKKRVQDFSLVEYERTFDALGTSPYWLTFSGGEPFLRPDLPDIILAAQRRCRPHIINIPTNGLLQQRVVGGVARMTREAPDTQFVVNLSLDGIGVRHDELRGVPGNYRQLRETYQELRRIAAPNLTVGIHSVISRANADEFSALQRHVREQWQPDSFITEVAEERVELDTMGMNITPDASKYSEIVDELIQDIDDQPAAGVAGVAQAFRRYYYQIALRTLTEQRQVLPCYAGIASGHIAPNGDVWTCCVRAEPIGNLRESDYDLRPIWKGKSARTLRTSIARGECHCPLANAAYSSMYCHVPTLAKVAGRWFKERVANG